MTIDPPIAARCGKSVVGIDLSLNPPRQPTDFNHRANTPEDSGLVTFSPCQPSRYTSTEDISLAPDSFEAPRGVHFRNRLFFESFLGDFAGSLGNFLSCFCGNAFDVGGNDVFRTFLEDRDTPQSFRDQ